MLTLIQSHCLHCTGAELASAARHQTGERGVLLMLLTAASITALKNTGLGFIVGACSAACSSAFAAMQLLSCAGWSTLLCWPAVNSVMRCWLFERKTVAESWPLSASCSDHASATSCIMPAALTVRCLQGWQQPFSCVALTGPWKPFRAGWQSCSTISQLDGHDQLQKSLVVSLLCECRASCYVADQPHMTGDSDRLLWLQRMEAMICCAVANIELSDQGQAVDTLLQTRWVIAWMTQYHTTLHEMTNDVLHVSISNSFRIWQRRMTDHHLPRSAAHPLVQRQTSCGSILTDGS